jgi:hypothetical protein
LLLSSHERESRFNIAALAEPNDQFVVMIHRRELPRVWDTAHFCFGVDVSGFIGKYTSQEAIARFLARIKAFYGLLLIFGIAEFERGFPVARSHSPVLRFGTPHGNGISWLSDEDSAQLHGVHVKDPTSLTPTHERVLRTLVPTAFRAEYDRIRTAVTWYFDSYVGANPLLAFLQATIALEILYGDKATSDLVGIGRLIANRCTYSIAETFDERDRIIGQISETYDTRSAVVHRGKEELTANKKRMLITLRQLCGRSIARELLAAHNAGVGNAPTGA